MSSGYRGPQHFSDAHFDTSQAYSPEPPLQPASSRYIFFGGSARNATKVDGAAGGVNLTSQQSKPSMRKSVSNMFAGMGRSRAGKTQVQHSGSPGQPGVQGAQGGDRSPPGAGVGVMPPVSPAHSHHSETPTLGAVSSTATPSAHVPAGSNRPHENAWSSVPPQSNRRATLQSAQEPPPYGCSMPSSPYAWAASPASAQSIQQQQEAQRYYSLRLRGGSLPVEGDTRATREGAKGGREKSSSNADQLHSIFECLQSPFETFGCSSCSSPQRESRDLQKTSGPAISSGRSPHKRESPMATSKSPSKSTTDKASSQEHRHGEQAKARDNNNEVLKYGQVGAKLDSSNQVDKQQLINILKLNLEATRALLPQQASQDADDRLTRFRESLEFALRDLEGASTDPRKQLGADQKWALSQAADGTKVTSNRSLDQRGYRVSQEDDVQRVVATADMYVHYVEFVYRSGKKQTFHFSEWTGDASHSMEQLDLELRKGEYLSKVAVANDSKGVRSIQFWTSHGRYSDWFGSSEEGVSRTSRSTCTAPKGKHVFALLAKDARLIGIKVLTIGEASDCPELITPHEESQAVEWSWQPKVEDKKGKQKRYALPFPEVEDSAHIKEFKEDMYVQANEIIHQFKRGAETECVIGSLSSSQRHHLKELAADEMIRCSIERGSEGQQLIVLRK